MNDRCPLVEPACPAGRVRRNDPIFLGVVQNGRQFGHDYTDRRFGVRTLDGLPLDELLAVLVLRDNLHSTRVTLLRQTSDESLDFIAREFIEPESA